jgi:hypothetical protein
MPIYGKWVCLWPYMGTPQHRGFFLGLTKMSPSLLLSAQSSQNRLRSPIFFNNYFMVKDYISIKDLINHICSEALTTERMIPSGTNIPPIEVSNHC